MRTKLFWIRGLVVLILAVAALAIGGYWRFPSTLQAQPLRMSHANHVKEAKCTACHRTVAKAERAGTPTTAKCNSCHKGKQSKDPEGLKEEAKLATYIDRKAEIPWIRLYSVPPHVFFSHQAHVLAKVECDSCHGPIGKEAVLPVRAPNPEAISMKACMGCHAQQKADDDCLACHR
jgi:hypothetical protein